MIDTDMFHKLIMVMLHAENMMHYKEAENKGILQVYEADTGKQKLEKLGQMITWV